jgi:hypothetical protein
MLDKTPQADRILIAQLGGEAKHHARWRELTEEEHAAAVGELRKLAGNRSDLLAYVAGVELGFTEGDYGEPLGRQIAGLCRDAGADLEAIPAWIEVGRERKANAGRPPFSAANYRRPGRRGPAG